MAAQTPAELQGAYDILGVQPGVSPLKARQRYRQLVKEWHPDRHPKDAESQALATRKTQETTAAYRTIKEAARHGEVPLRVPRAWRPNPARDRVARFVGGMVVGIVVDFGILADSVVVWVTVPLAVGAVVAIFGWSVLEWALRKLWWLS
jgi:hypothetical protein